MFNRKLVFAAACLGMLLFGIVFLSLGSVVNLLQARFNLDNNHIGTLTALLPLGMLAGSLIFGPVVDRFGYKTLLISCSVVVMAGLEIIAFGVSLSSIKCGIVLIGFGGGILNGATNALVADISAGERGARLSILGIFFGIGALGMPGILAVLSQHFSQAAIVKGVGLFVVLPLIWFVSIRFPSPKMNQFFSWKSITSILREPWLWIAGMILFFQSGLEGTTNDWAPRFLKQMLSHSDQDALYLLTLYVAALTITRLLLGSLLKNLSSRSVLFASLFCAMAGAALLFFARQPSFVCAALILLGIGYAACFPVILGFIGDEFAERSGTAFSVAFTFALIGNMVVNKSMGHVANLFSIRQFPVVLFACLAAMSVLLVFLLLFQKGVGRSVSPMAQESSPPLVHR